MKESIDPRLEAELDKIGWQRAKNDCTLRGSLFQLAAPDERGGLMFLEKDKARGRYEAADAAKELEDVTRAMADLEKAIDRVAPARRSLINHACASPDEHETGVYVDRLDLINQVMHDALTGCIEAMDIIDHEIQEFPAKDGRPKVHRAYRVAAQIAEIYVLGLGKMPEYRSIRLAKGGQSDKPTSLYGCVTENVFDLLDIPGGTRNPCESAITQLEGGRFETLMSWRRLKGRRLPLFKT